MVEIDDIKEKFQITLREGLSIVKNYQNASEISEKMFTLYLEMEYLLAIWEERRILLEIVKDYLTSPHR